MSAHADPGPAQDWFGWVNAPTGSALYADALGVNPCALGAIGHMPQNMLKFIARAYQAEALAELCWQPEQPVWFVKSREAYARRYRDVAGK